MNTEGRDLAIAQSHYAALFAASDTYLARIAELEAALAEANKRAEEARRAAILQSREVEQALGKALGYPWYKDDQGTFPGATEVHGVCVGDHTATSLADEAAARIVSAERALAEANKRVEAAGGGCNCG